jgi:hypothetical protein
MGDAHLRDTKVIWFRDIPEGKRATLNNNVALFLLSSLLLGTKAFRILMEILDVHGKLVTVENRKVVNV